MILIKAAYFAGHSLGEYSALACTEAISFSDTLKILKKRGISMQNAVPQNEGGMLVVLGESADNIQKILDENKKILNVSLQMIIRVSNLLSVV